MQEKNNGAPTPKLYITHFSFLKLEIYQCVSDHERVLQKIMETVCRTGNVWNDSKSRRLASVFNSCLTCSPQIKNTSKVSRTLTRQTHINCTNSLCEWS